MARESPKQVNNIKLYPMTLKWVNFNIFQFNVTVYNRSPIHIMFTINFLNETYRNATNVGLSIQFEFNQLYDKSWTNCLNLLNVYADWNFTELKSK